MLALANSGLNYNQKLYRFMKDPEYNRYPFHKEDLGDHMSCICEGYSEFVVARYLINHQLKEAYEVDSGLSFIKPEDIASEAGGKALGIYPPIIINRFVNGLALFEWNTVEDGRAWLDEEGYGMRSDNPTFLYGVINQRMEVIGKIRYIDDMHKVNEYRRNPLQFIADYTS